MAARKRNALIVAGLILLVGGLVAVKALQVSTITAYAKDAARAGPPPSAVGSAVARADTWETTISAAGTVTGAKTVAVSNDAPGVIERIRFESGAEVKQGDVLVELDASVERGQVATARAKRKLARI